MDGIEEACLSVEHKAIGIGNMTNDILWSAEVLKYLAVDAKQKTIFLFPASIMPEKIREDFTMWCGNNYIPRNGFIMATTREAT